MSSHPHLRGILCMVLSAGAFVATDCCMKILMPSTPPLEVLFLRSLFAVTWGAMAVVAMGYLAELPRLLDRWIILRGLFESVAVLCFGLGLAHMQLADITAIYQVAPLFVLLGAALLFGQRVGRLKLALVIAGFTGALLVAQPGSSAASPYALLGFGVALGAAGRDLAAMKSPSTIPPFLTGYATIVIVFLAAGMSGLATETWVMPTMDHLGLMVLAGFLLNFAQLLTVLAYRLAPAPVIAPFFYVFVLWAVLAGVFLFGERLNLLAVFGMVVIVASGLVILWLDRRDQALPGRSLGTAPS